jgi:uncharacterized protein (TIGR03437 family)
MLKRLLAILLVTIAAYAKEPLAECGSFATKAQEEAFLHAQSQRRTALARAAGTLREAVSRPNQDFGNIATIGAGKGVVAARNPFDLAGRTLTFTPTGTGYAVAARTESFDNAAALGGSKLNLDDDDTEAIALPFAFRYFGAPYRQAFVNSNGSVSFTAGDLDYSGAYGHFAAAPPTIAALFTDLDPSIATSNLRVLREATRVVVTWENMPLAGDRPGAATQTFQMRLHATGVIDITYTNVNDLLPNAVTGLTSGALAPIDLHDFSSGPLTSAHGIAEVYTSSLLPAIDIQAAAQRFYETHADAYDILAFYNVIPVQAGSGVVAYEITTRSAGLGFGDSLTDVGTAFGSPRRLQAVLNLGPTSQYPIDPNARVASRGAIGDTPLTILAHEAGHLHLALVSVPSTTFGATPPMLGAGLAHWAFPFHTDASVMEGNRIEDLGQDANPRFRTTATVERFSDLDQYLMGFRLVNEVPPSFAVVNSGLTNSRPPQTGVTFNGTRLDIPIDDIVAAAGRRTPDATIAQRAFRMAFVLIVPEEPSFTADALLPAAIAQIDRYRADFPAFYAKATNFRATMDTTLGLGPTFSLAPASGLIVGESATATIEVPTPVASAQTFTLTGQSGLSAPTQITLPSGARRASFQVTAQRPGVSDLLLSSPGYLAEVARVQARAANELTPLVAAGDKRTLPSADITLRLRAADVNHIGFPGQTISVVGAPGSVQPLAAVSNPQGDALFRWTPSGTASQQVTFGLANGTTVAATALGTPVVRTGGVVNGASFAGPLAPGGYASVFGIGLAAGRTATAVLLHGTYPTSLGNVSLTLNGTAVPLTFVSDDQINFVVPGNILPGTSQLTVQTTLGSTTIPVMVQAIAPGLFVAQGQAAAVVAGSRLLTGALPAKPSDFLEIYCTGLGGSQNVTVRIGGVSVPVTYVGDTAYPALSQVNVRIPTGVAPGFQELVLEVAGIRANTAPILVATGP